MGRYPEVELAIKALFFISSALLMICIAGFGYFVAMFVVNASHEKREED